jgi:alkanesulfonate monooxygenase SsuD/methylene tetrahydromethanopterin reductase-like flavin-dependent oxidoreductase (luciferase family)
MRYCINVPNFGNYYDADLVAGLAVDAEDAGWDGFFIWDHLQGYGPVGDPLIALATIATRTSRIRLGAMITPLPRRRPWKVAKETVSLDHLSKGRLIVGVGLGNPPQEYSDFGEDPNTRVRAEKLDEGLDILKGLWTGEPFSYHGKHYQLKEMTFLPKPVQRPRIPIWVAGFWPNKRPFRRAAHFHGVYPTRNWPDSLTVDDLKLILNYVARHRNSTESFDVVVGGQTPHDAETGSKIIRPWIRAGATWWSEDINGWRGSIEEMRNRICSGPPKT